MRIASYNIRKAVGLDWRRDAQRILDVLSEINADVVVIQEADKRIGQRAGVLPLLQLEKELGLTPAEVSIRPASHGWHGNAILVRKQTEIAHAHRVELPCFEPRGAVSVALKQPNIEIIGAHLALTRSVRRKQIAALTDHMEQSKNPLVLAGDFNERAMDETAFGERAEIVTPGHSFHASRPFASLDRFVLFGGVTHRASHVHNSPLARRASDHLPIVMDIELGDGQ